MRWRFMGVLLLVFLPVSLLISTADVSAEELTERQKLLRQLFQPDPGPPIKRPLLTCGKIDASINESGRTIKVNTADDLQAALQGAKAGDVIELGAADYGRIVLKDMQFSDYVKIKGSDGAKIKHLGLNNVKNLQIENANFEYGSAAGEDWKPKIIEMRNVERVRILNSSIMGNRNASNWRDDLPDTAIRVYENSKDVTISGVEISYVMRGIIFQQVNNYTIENNSFTNMGCDGLVLQNSSQGLIESNYFSDFRPFIYAEQGKTCHADFIQFDAGKGRNTRNPSSNVIIRGNVMLQGQDGSSCRGPGSVCGAVQGIFLEGATGAHPQTGQRHKFENIRITDNVYCASGRNGLYVNNGINVNIENNAHYTCPPPFGSDHSSRIVLRGTHVDSAVSGNTEKRVANQMEAILDAKRKGNLTNCVLGNLP